MALQEHGDANGELLAGSELCPVVQLLPVSEPARHPLVFTVEGYALHIVEHEICDLQRK